MINRREHHGCPVRAAVNVMSGKWKVQIIWHLSFGQLRFAELRRKLGRVSEKVQTEQLRQLEFDGILKRHVSGSVPPAVTYSLSAAGKELIPLMEKLCDWGSRQFGIEPTLTRAPSSNGSLRKP